MKKLWKSYEKAMKSYEKQLSTHGFGKITTEVKKAPLFYIADALCNCSDCCVQFVIAIWYQTKIGDADTTRKTTSPWKTRKLRALVWIPRSASRSLYVSQVTTRPSQRYSEPPARGARRSLRRQPPPAACRFCRSPAPRRARKPQPSDRRGPL